MNTTPRAPDRLQAALVGRLILESVTVEHPLLRWRHHKIGVLQAYVVEGKRYYDMETRIHVWHPSLALADEDSGRMHDHRFDLRSYVLLGAIHDTEIKTIPAGSSRGVLPPEASGPASRRDPAESGTGTSPPADLTGESLRSGAGNPEDFGGLYEVWDIQNARSAAQDGKHWVTPTNPGREHFFLDKTCHLYSQGSSYSYQARRFHRSEVTELTVTLCTKTNQSSSPARLLARVGAEPKHAFDPGPKHGELMHDHRMLLRDAAEQLLEVARNWSNP